MRRWKPAGGRRPPLVRSPLPGRGRRAGKRQWWGRCSLKVNANGLVFQRSAGPLGQGDVLFGRGPAHADGPHQLTAVVQGQSTAHQTEDRKSTRLNSSHVAISYAVFCLKKKTT